MTQLQSSRIVSQINSLFNTLSFVICGIFLVWVDICLMGVRFALTLLRGFQSMLVTALTGSSSSDASTNTQTPGPSTSTNPLTYLALAWQRFLLTLAEATDQMTYWAALSLLDLTAWWSVWRSHETQHKIAISGIAQSGNSGKPISHCNDTLEELLCGAVHARACYGAQAKDGYMSNAVGYAALLTVMQVTGRAPRKIPTDRHIAALEELVSIKPDDIIKADWQSHMHFPAYYIAINRDHGRIIVAIRGTLQLGDYSTVLDATSLDVNVLGVDTKVHSGMYRSAENLMGVTLPALQVAAAQVPGWPVMVTGHSLGGGVAGLLTALLLEAQENGDPRLRDVGDIKCVGLGPMSAMCDKLSRKTADNVTSLIYGADTLPMLSIDGVRQLLEEMQSASNAAKVAARFASLSAKKGVQAAADEVIKEELQASGKASKVTPSGLLGPPGRILWVVPKPAKSKTPDTTTANGIVSGGKPSLAKLRSARHMVVSVKHTDATQMPIRFGIFPKTASHHVTNTYIDALHELKVLVSENGRD